MKPPISDNCARLLLLRLAGLRCIRLGGFGLRRRLCGLVHALDLGGLAQLCDVVGLRLAGHIGLDLAPDLFEAGRLAVALFLDLDDVPAELRLRDRRSCRRRA